LAGQWHALRFRPELATGLSALDSLDVSLLQKHVLAPVFGIADQRTSKDIQFVGGIRGTAELESLSIARNSLRLRMYRLASRT